MAKTSRRYWESGHIRKLREGARRRRGVRKIARDLRRTENAVRQMAHKLSISLAVS